MTLMTYDTAKSNCASKFSNGGKLFEPATWHHSKLVWEAYKDTIVPKSFGPWIGVNDVASESNLQYVSSGGSIPFSPPWLPNYSNNDRWDCVLLWHKSNNAKWRTFDCSGKQPSICQQ